jgi:hypothetical protein
LMADHDCREGGWKDKGVRSWAPADVRDTLQWGRVRLNAERAERGLGPRIRRAASMGPRSFERGKRPPRDERSGGDASMGPRSFERGKMGRSRFSSRTSDWLQWGRVRLNAESGRSNPLDKYACGGLQWGRVRLNAESSCRPTPRNSSYRSFNGAAFV